MTVPETHLSHPKYRPDIDGLRAIAVLAVVAFHAFPSWLTGGFIGVDVFFVISGYLISTIIFENLDSRTFSFYEFYARRIKRIFPALILVLVACLWFGWFALLAQEYKQLGKHIAAGAGFISNLVFWEEAGYFDNAADTKPLLHLWSLGIEEQFYVVWPILLWVSWKRKFNLFIVTILIAIASFALNLKGIRQDAVATFYAPQTRFWELLCGSILAWLTLYKKSALVKFTTKNISHAISFFGLLLLAYGFWRINKALPFPGTWALVPVVGAVCIIAAGPAAWVNRTILSNQFAVWLGLISFPLYLWHWPLLSFARLMEGEVPSRAFRIGAVAFAVILAWLTYVLIERRVRVTGKVSCLVLLMVVTGCLGYSTYIFDGLNFRNSLQGITPPIIKLAEDDVALHNACLANLGLETKNIRFCRLSGNGIPHIAIIGDSHGAALFSPLAYSLDQRYGEGLLMIGGRLFINVATYPDASPFENAVYKGGIEATKFVANEKKIDTVIMVSRGPFYISGSWHFYLLDEPNLSDRKKVFELGMRATLDLLVKNKKKLIFVLENPTLNFNPEICSESRPLRMTKRPNDCTIQKSKFELEHKEYRDLVSLILKEYPEVKIVDPSIYLCDAQFCHGKLGNKVLYADADHLSYDGSAVLSKALLDIIAGYKLAK